LESLVTVAGHVNNRLHDRKGIVPENISASKIKIHWDAGKIMLTWQGISKSTMTTPATCFKN